MHEKEGISGSMPRRDFLRGSGSALLAAGLPATYTRIAAAADDEAPLQWERARRVPVRTITAGLNVTTDAFKAPLERAREFLTLARDSFEAAEITVQTTRIVTQPHALYAGELSAAAFQSMLDEMRSLAGPHQLAVGPGLIDDRNDPAAIDKALRAAAAGVSSTIVIASALRGIYHRAIDAAAEVIHGIAAREPAQNFNFGAIANVAPGVPFFPAGYHGESFDNFAVGTEGAGLFLAVCAEVANFEAAGPALLAAYGETLQRIEQVGLEIERQTGRSFAGIDTTPAQWGEKSIAAGVERLTQAPFGTPGTLAACRLMTRVVKQVPVRQTGYRGLFLPPMEDATLAARAFEHYGLDSLLSYSAVCGTGLDAVAVPGDATVDELRRILRDVASLAVQLDKPLTARLFPVPGKQAGELTGPVGDLFPMTVLAVR